jgi:hypothetical protein
MDEMFSFRDMLLIESSSSKKDGASHVEDLPIKEDYLGSRKSIDALNRVHDSLRGQKNNVKILDKYDDVAALAFGRHPDNGRFFVATVSNTGKIGKPMFNTNDLSASGSPLPKEHLAAALKHLPKVTPNDGVYGGAVMYTDRDLEYDGKLLSFKPGPITYSAHEASANGEKMKRAKVGVVVIAKYKGNKLPEMTPTFDVDQGSFGDNSDVHVITSDVDVAKQHHSPQSQRAFQKHMSQAVEIAEGMEYDHQEEHRDQLVDHVEKMSQGGEKANLASYKSAISNKSKLRTEAVAKDDKKLNYVEQNKDAFNNTFKLHHHLQEAKHSLIESLSSYNGFAQHIGKTPVKSTGFVVVVDGTPLEFSNRHNSVKMKKLVSSYRKSPDEPTAD